MGHFYTINNKLFTEIIVMNQCKAYNLEAELTIQEDTIYYEPKEFNPLISVYIKEKVSAKILKDWFPDW